VLFEEFARTVAGSFGSIRNTLVHVMSAEWGWLERCGGAARGPALKADDYPTFESVAETWSAVDRQLRQTPGLHVVAEEHDGLILALSP